MEALTYEQTDERRRIDAALVELETRATDLAGKASDRRDRHRLLNVAQGISANRTLLQRDWHEADEAARGERPAA